MGRPLRLPGDEDISVACFVLVRCMLRAFCFLCVSIFNNVRYKRRNKKTHVLVGLFPQVYLHAPRLAFLLGAGTGAGAHAFLSASSTGVTSGTGAPPSALSIGPVMSLLYGR